MCVCGELEVIHSVHARARARACVCVYMCVCVCVLSVCLINVSI